MPPAQGSTAAPPSVLTSVGTALLVDAADLITFGAIGVWTGFLLGAVLGWTLAPQLGFPERRWLPAVFAGAYCMMPGTALVPLAAIVTGVRGWAEKHQQPEPPADPPARPGAIEADYEARWDAEGDEDRTGPRD